METQSLSCCSLVAGGILKLSEEKQQRISHDLQFDGGRVVQFHLGVLSTYSYLLCSCNAAMLIDPGRDVKRYEEYLFENNIQLCGVFLTHIHSDFVSGHIEAGKRFNVPIFLSRESHAVFGHIPLDDDTNFSLGRLNLHFFAAPGHSEDGICLSAGINKENPEILFTGDAFAASLTDNSGMDWVSKVDQMQEDLRIYPAHEMPGADKNWTTLGRAKQHSHLFHPEQKTEVNHHHALHLEALREINRKGPEIIDRNNVLLPSEADISLAVPGAGVIDIRNCAQYAKNHIPYSLNIESNGKLEYWTAQLFEPAGEVVLVGEDENSLRETAQRLQVVGCTVNGILFDEWEKKALPVRRSNLMDVQELDTLMWSDTPPCILDVRSPAEWQKSRLSGSINIPLTELEKRLNELPRDKDIVIVCASGFRSAIAVGILERENFRSVSNLAGGLGAWLEEGKTLNSGTWESAHTPVPSKCGIKSPLADSAS